MKLLVLLIIFIAIIEIFIFQVERNNHLDKEAQRYFEMLQKCQEKK